MLSLHKIEVSVGTVCDSMFTKSAYANVELVFEARSELK